MKKQFSGFVEANQGFNGPVAFDGPQGWTVNKMQQTEIYKIHHGLNLSNPNKLRVVITTKKTFTIANVESTTANDFTVSVWTVGSATGGAPASSDFMFIAEA
jgi:hypothetical protein